MRDGASDIFLTEMGRGEGYVGGGVRGCGWDGCTVVWGFMSDMICDVFWEVCVVLFDSHVFVWYIIETFPGLGRCDMWDIGYESLDARVWSVDSVRYFMLVSLVGDSYLRGIC